MQHIQTQNNQAEILEYARTWVDVPFRHQGRTRKGVDCVGLLEAVALHAGFIQKRIPINYGMSPNARKMEAVIAQYMDRINVRDARPLDAFFMIGHKIPQHMALFTENGTIIHATKQIERVVEHTLTSIWRDTIVSAWRFPEAAHG